MCQMIHHESANDANVSEEFSFEFALVPPVDELRPSFRYTGESRYPSLLPWLSARARITTKKNTMWRGSLQFILC